MVFCASFDRLSKSDKPPRHDVTALFFGTCADGWGACPGEPGKHDGLETGIMGGPTARKNSVVIGTPLPQGSGSTRSGRRRRSRCTRCCSRRRRPVDPRPILAPARLGCLFYLKNKNKNKTKKIVLGAHVSTSTSYTIFFMGVNPASRLKTARGGAFV